MAWNDHAPGDCRNRGDDSLRDEEAHHEHHSPTRDIHRRHRRPSESDLGAGPVQIPRLPTGLMWQPPPVLRLSPNGDSVRKVLFSFYNGQLFRMVVTYDRDRTEGPDRC
jgi:hypothetical protein